MALEVLMPIITASGEEAVVTAWFVDEGAACSDGQLIAEVQAEKVSADVEAPGAGRVVNRVAVNDPVPQDSPICRIVESVEPTAVAATASSAAKSKASRPTAVASPAAKRVARELGVDLSAVAGSGPGGRITEADVGAAADLASPTAGRTELAGLRAVIARNMRRGHLETAPVTLTSRVDLTSAAPEQFTALLIKAVATALVDHPELNGVRDGDYFTPAPKANISVAIQTDQGLVAPVVVDPASKPVREISQEITSLAERARGSELEVSEHEGGTFTVTNLGSYGVDAFTPIINLPQVAILGAGAIRTEPVFGDDGSVIAGSRVVLSLTFDHAFVDGALAAAFLRQVAKLLAGPTFKTVL